MRSINNLEEIRKIIGQHKRWDLIFMIAGIFALMIAVLTFMTLFAHMLIDGMHVYLGISLLPFHHAGLKLRDFISLGWNNISYACNCCIRGALALSGCLSRRICV